MVPLNFRLSLRLSVRFGLGLIVTFGTFVGVAGCSTQSLVPTDGGGARTGSGGGTGTGNRSGGTAAETGTDSGAGGIVGTTGAGGAIGPRGAGGAIGPRGAGGIVGTTGAAGFGRPFGGAAGFGPSVGGGAGRGRPPIDASTTAPPQDAGACQCVIGADGVLRMSWDCFSANYGNGAPMSQWCGGPGGWVSSCGLEIFKLNRDNPAIPDDEWVYDATGATVGQQIAEDTPVFVCPSDLSLKAAVVAGGQFPPSGCAVTDCTCGDAGAVDCPVPDGGGSLPGLPIF
jgi:hypothetical protein